jgi:hypothetical protein
VESIVATFAGPGLTGHESFCRDMLGAVPSLDKVHPGTPLALGVVARLAFPDGTMTASGLRREAAPVRDGAGRRVRH